MQSERDPRTDPQPGDVLRWEEGGGGPIQRAVLEVVPRVRVPLIKFLSTFGDGKSVTYQLGLYVWRKWAAGATVIRRAGDKP